jgi:mannobiose 2-epimerase
MESKRIVEQAELQKLKAFAQSELLNDILPFWIEHAPDYKHGGFIGRISMDNKPDFQAEKGLVLNARILWTFSSAARAFGIPDCKLLARDAYNYLCKKFADSGYEGYYWLLDPEGNPFNTKKQVYAQAFVLYAFSEFFMLTGEQEVLDKAIKLYHLIEKTSFDKEKNGYFEAFSRDWGPIGDLRLSTLDMNEKKTMNTHLHIIEGYANLYRAWKDAGLKERIINLLHVFEKHIIDAKDYHFRLFFDENWQSKSDTISYGHDVEGSWLLHEAAGLTGDVELTEKFRKLAVNMAHGTLPAITHLGGLCHETEREHPDNKGELEWWAQAEAVVGYFNAWQASGNIEFLYQASGLSDFIMNYFVDVHGGEWYYRLTPEGEPIMSYDKLGMWKCPYHNSRMCLELLRRIALP